MTRDCPPSLLIVQGIVLPPRRQLLCAGHRRVLQPPPRARAGTPSVAWGLSASALTAVSNGTRRTYSIEDMCGAPANLTRNWQAPGYVNDAVMRGLPPKAQIFYRYGACSPATTSCEWGAVSTFQVGLKSPAVR